MNQKNIDVRDYSYVFCTKKRLELVQACKHSSGLVGLRKKWATAAILTLASGSVFIFSPNGQVKAAENSNVAKQVSNSEKQTNVADFQAKHQSGLAKSAGTVEDNTLESKQQENTPVSAQTSENGQVEKANAQTQAASANSAQNNGTQADDQTQPDTNLQNQVTPPANNQDHVKGNVQSAWDQGYKGEHTVVAVIDSGVDTSHKDFQTMPKDPKLTADQMKEMIAKLGYGRYVNEKFPFVHNYVDNSEDDIKPEADEPHGQHVSGIIAADGQPDGDKEYVVGVAPEAQLLQLRVFSADGTSLDLAKQIVDAVNLGADVIQMSLGGGVAAADLGVADQKAVQYAVDHGVIVSISASNNGNAASVDNTSHITDSDYQSGGNAGNYEPFSSSTVADPGASRNAITVAAETSDTGKDSDMASFSSWGPLPDFTLKPDISAPGSDVTSLANDNQYTKMSGTSMAGPFAAGAAALVKERLAKTNPELKGAELVKAVKALLMNTANPQTQNGYTTPVSPRRQGAGQINVGDATASPVYITTDDGTGALSLRKVGENTEFTLTLHNLSDKAQTYTFDDMGGGFTEKREEDSGIFYDVQLAGANVYGADAVTVAPKSDAQVKYTLKLSNLRPNQLVEGFLNFTNTETKKTLVVPYLSYYGDMTNENVFDNNANEDNDIQGNRWTNEDNYPRGIADQDSLKKLINVDGKYNWQEVAKLYESGKVAFSPNNDNKSDLVRPYAYLKQNVEDLKVEILDAKGNVVRVLGDSHGIQKSYHADGEGTVDMGYSASDASVFDWDGKLYDAQTGKMVVAPDGNYTYRFVATLYNDGPHQVQTHDTQVIIDTIAPTLSNVKFDQTNSTLSGDYKDTGAGFTSYSYGTVTINDKVFGFKLDDQEQSVFSDHDKTSGHFEFKLTPEELNAFSGAGNKVTVAISDVADNTAALTLDLAGQAGKPEVSVWNATNGLAFNQKMEDYDAKTNTYTLRGGATKDFYLNGKLVQVASDQYAVPVAADEKTPLVFSSDQAGHDVLLTFTPATLKAKFAWQHVDGEKKSFGPEIYSVFGSNDQDIVVQAAVTKGDNVQAFAQDYFTKEIYTATVKDGVATFHIHTSSNKGKDGKFARALLKGWTEIVGPTFNDKQKTATTDINDEVYIGVYYDPTHADQQPYTDRDKLGVEMTDEVADTAAFGPTPYPGYEPEDKSNKDIHFDYLTDGGVSNLGLEAVENGYYDPATNDFTLTGHVDSNVVSLTAMVASGFENDPNNQIDIHNNGKFTIVFKMPHTGHRYVQYIYKTTDGTEKRGSVGLILDIVKPTLLVDQLGNQDEAEFTTNKPTFKLSGVANDNLDGYKFYLDGDNLFSQFNGSGYDYVAGLYASPDTTNDYGSHKFEKEEVLDDNHGQPTTHVFTIAVVDQLGNKLEKKVIVHYDPNFVETPVVDPDQNNGNANHNDNGQAPVTVPTSTTENSFEQGNSTQSDVKNDVTPSLADAAKEKTFVLTHAALVYDQDGQVLATNNKVQRLEKGATISAWNNGQVVKIKEQQFLQVGTNAYVKLANTFMKKLVVRNAYVYNASGRALSVDGKIRLIKKGHYVYVWNNGELFEIHGRKYYRIGENAYIKLANLQATKYVLLKKNAYVYDHNGQVVKNHTKRVLLKKGTKHGVWNNGKTVLIHGKRFYQLGQNSYVKVVNAKLL